MNSTAPTAVSSRWPHRVAVGLVCATFPLIWVGGLVTTYDAGMAVPDWPNTFGYNLFRYPWTTWIGGPWDLFIEHGHRLLGAGVGMLTIGLVAACWWGDRRGWVRLASLLALLLVIGQGILGGARVLFDEVLLARLHGCTGPLFFATCVAIAGFTSRWWQETTAVAAGQARNCQRLSWMIVAVAYLQLVLGAHLRHLPVGMDPAVFRALVVAHLAMAAVLVGHVGWFLVQVAWSLQGPAQRVLIRPAVALGGLVLLQILLGVATWMMKYGWPTWLPATTWGARLTVQSESLAQAGIVTLHVAVGSLILGTAVHVALRSVRRLRRPGEAAEAPSMAKSGPVRGAWT